MLFNIGSIYFISSNLKYSIVNFQYARTYIQCSFNINIKERTTCVLMMLSSIRFYASQLCANMVGRADYECKK